MVVFKIGLLICALAPSSPIFVAGRAISGPGSAGQFGGFLSDDRLRMRAKTRPLVSAVAMSMISVGSMTGPMIAGVLTPRAGWRWSFWMFLGMGGGIMLIILLLKLPEISEKPPPEQALKSLPQAIDPVGFILFSAAATMLLLTLTWGSSELPWASPTIVGLACGGLGVLTVFFWWVERKEDDALIPLSCLAHGSVYVGSILMFLQGGASWAIPFFLPLWFQAVKGDGSSEHAVYLMPSLVTTVVSLITFAALERELNYIPPWAIVGSALTSVGSGLLTTLALNALIG